jgi:hypothetical protein
MYRKSQRGFIVTDELVKKAKQQVKPVTEHKPATTTPQALWHPQF